MVPGDFLFARTLRIGNELRKLVLRILLVDVRVVRVLRRKVEPRGDTALRPVAREVRVYIGRGLVERALVRREEPAGIRLLEIVVEEGGGDGTRKRRVRVLEELVVERHRLRIADRLQVAEEVLYEKRPADAVVAVYEAYDARGEGLEQVPRHDEGERFEDVFVYDKGGERCLVRDVGDGGNGGLDGRNR